MKYYLLLGMLCLCSLTFAQVKTVSILGDSYSAFKGHVTPSSNKIYYSPTDKRTDVKSVSQMWWSIVIDKERWSLDTNNSYSGSTICNTGYSGEDYSTISYTKRMEQLGFPDIIFIFGATNDSWDGAPMGNYKYSGFTASDLYFFRPAMADMLEACIEMYPKAKIYFILNTDLSNAINSSVHTICDYYGIRCIALKNISKISGHPSVRGHQQIAEQVIAVLEEEKQVSSIINYDYKYEEPEEESVQDETIEPVEGGTDEGTTGIVCPNAASTSAAEWFSLDGQALAVPHKGLNIRRTADGKIIKQVVK